MRYATQLRRLVHTVCLGGTLSLMGAIIPAVAGLPETDTTTLDVLGKHVEAVGVGSHTVGNGERVDMFSGNFMVTHASSPVIPIDVSRSLGLSRTYNSNKVRLDRVKSEADGQTHPFLIGRSWVGLGWTSHLGRVFARSDYRDNSGNWDYFLTPSYYESPTGGLIRRIPSMDSAAPIVIGYHQEYECVEGDPTLCSQKPWAPGCTEEEPCVNQPTGVDWYEVTFPGGTVHKLEKIINPAEWETRGWIANYDRAGYYTTLITTKEGKKTYIEYWGSSYPFPEAIKRIFVDDNGDSVPEDEIYTTLCQLNDPDPAQCPDEAEGMLKEVHATGFGGASVVYRHHYDLVQITDTDGTHQVPVLAQVDLPEVDLVSPGSIVYEYETAMSPGGGAAAHGPLLTRIRYPQGAVVEAEYGQWYSGVLRDSPITARMGRGVTKLRTFPSGLGVNGDGVGQPNYTWEWDRSLVPDICATPTFVSNSYKLTSPDGRVVETEMFGHPCSGTEDAGPYGVPKKTTVYDGLGANTKLRTTEITWAYEPDTESEDQLREIVQHVKTTYEDDNGSCFGGGAAGATRYVEQELRHRDPWNQWRMAVLTGDYFHDDWQRVEYTNFTPSSPPCLSDLVGTYDYRFVEEKGLDGQPDAYAYRFEENAVFDCSGHLTSETIKDEWATTGVILNPDPSLDTIPGNAASDATDLVATYTFTGDELSGVDSGGGDDYPDSSPSNDYTTSHTWERGQIATTQPTGVSYLTTDLSIDSSGFVTQSRDPNGRATSFIYDELGRVTQIQPANPIEHKTRLEYPTLNETRTIVSSGTATGFDPADPEQLYSEVVTDGLGRVIEERRSIPDDTLSLRVTRYDQLGRRIFVSEWIPDDHSDTTSWTTAVGDYTVDGIPVDSGIPLGTTVFYGDPDPADPDNPLKATPDGLGRVRRIVAADETGTRLDYCGPHEQTTVEGVATGLGVTSDVVTRNYYDGLGRLVLVDAPADSVDAEYSYDARGNLVDVNLVGQLPPNPYDEWKAGNIASGQVRIFTYDAAGRLESAADPDSGQKEYVAYDSGGNLLAWRDAMGVRDAYFFRNTYDALGRLTRVEKVHGVPETPATADVDLAAGMGDFEEPTDLNSTGTGPEWGEGSLAPPTGRTFEDVLMGWKQVAYGTCIPAPPGGTNTGGLYFGDYTACSYDAAPTDPKFVRLPLNGVAMDDVLSFKYWREVREGDGTNDKLSVFVMDSHMSFDMSYARYLLNLDSGQASFATWRQTPFMRLRDVFSDAEWSSGTKDLDLYIVFEKGVGPTGVGRGIMIDDVVVGHLAAETIAEYFYDTDECAAGEAGEACSGGEEASNLHLGNATRSVSYSSGRPLMEEYLVYKGRNGRLSGRQLKIDWAGVGDFSTFVHRYAYDTHGQVDTYDAPYTPGIEPTRMYELAYRRGFFDGISNNGKDFVTPGASPASITYSPSGVPRIIRYANGATQQIGLDVMSRPEWIDVTSDLGGGPTNLLSTGSYAYDGAGNIREILHPGDPPDSPEPKVQRFAYDEANRLTNAEVLPRATDSTEASPAQLSYAYDPYGNMTGRDYQPSASEPAGMGFTHTYDPEASGNKILEPNYAYDANGNMTRIVSSDVDMSATWTSTGQLAAFYAGQPEASSHRVKERYSYDHSGARILRYPEGDDEDGRPVITIRDPGGTPMSEFIVDPATGQSQLDRDYVYGAGRLLVEREVEQVAPAIQGSDPLSSTNVAKYLHFDVVESAGSTTYTVDIRTDSGFVNQLSGVTPVNGKLKIIEDEFSVGEVNYVRVRGEGGPAVYSVPVTVAIDPLVLPGDPNQTRAVSVSRVDTDVLITFSLELENGKKSDIFFERGDTGQNKKLTNPSLDAGVASYTISEQSLSTSCGLFKTKQSGSFSIGSDLQIVHVSQNVDAEANGCDDGGGGPGPTPEAWIFGDRYHHRDHLGTLRVVTNDSGAADSLHDFYPFGIEMFDPVAGPPGDSRMRYTVHERDQTTGADYMMARYKIASSASFMSADRIYDVRPSNPSTWNKFSYVAGNPVAYIDPTGNKSTLEVCAVLGIQDCSGGGYPGFAPNPSFPDIWTSTAPFGAYSGEPFVASDEFDVGGLLAAANYASSLGLWRYDALRGAGNFAKRLVTGRFRVQGKPCGSRPPVPPLPAGYDPVQILAESGRTVDDLSFPLASVPRMVAGKAEWDFKFRLRVTPGTPEFELVRDFGNFHAGYVLGKAGYGRYATQVGGGLVSLATNPLADARGLPPGPWLPPDPLGPSIGFTIGVPPYGDLNNSRNTAAYVPAGWDYYRWELCMQRSKP